MPKRIALFVLGVVLAVGAFLLYQFLHPTNNSPKFTRASAAPTLPMLIEEIDSNGRTIYRITAPKPPEPIRDATGKPIPGQFRLEYPVASFYDKTGHPKEFKAEVCEISLSETSSLNKIRKVEIHNIKVANPYDIANLRQYADFKQLALVFNKDPNPSIP